MPLLTSKNVLFKFSYTLCVNLKKYENTFSEMIFTHWALLLPQLFLIKMTLMHAIDDANNIKVATARIETGTKKEFRKDKKYLRHFQSLDIQGVPA